MTKWTRKQVQEMHRLYTQEVWPLDIVGAVFELSGESVRQLFAREGLATRPRGANSSTSAIRNLREAQKRNDEIIHAYKKIGNVDDVAEEFDLPPIYISRVVENMKLRELYRRKGQQHIYSPDKIKHSINRAAEIEGEPLTIPGYRRVARAEQLPSLETILKFFPSFEAACRAASVKANPAQGTRKGTISQQDCLRALRACRRAHHGVIPTYREYLRWAKLHNQPSGPTVRNKFPGGWGEALRKAFQ